MVDIYGIWNTWNVVEIYKALNVIMAFHNLLLYPTLVRQCGDDEYGDDTDHGVYISVNISIILALSNGIMASHNPTSSFSYFGQTVLMTKMLIT